MWKLETRFLHTLVFMSCLYFVDLGQLRARASVSPSAKKKIWTDVPLKFL